MLHSLELVISCLLIRQLLLGLDLLAHSRRQDLSQLLFNLLRQSSLIDLVKLLQLGIPLLYLSRYLFALFDFRLKQFLCVCQSVLDEMDATSACPILSERY